MPLCPDASLRKLCVCIPRAVPGLRLQSHSMAPLFDSMRACAGAPSLSLGPTSPPACRTPLAPVRQACARFLAPHATTIGISGASCDALQITTLFPCPPCVCQATFQRKVLFFASARRHAAGPGRTLAPIALPSPPFDPHGGGPLEHASEVDPAPLATARAFFMRLCLHVRAGSNLCEARAL